MTNSGSRNGSRSARLARCPLALFVAVAFVLFNIRIATAGPVIIRDALISDTGITPVLGRGYSIATNTYQSICLSDVPKTKPSYNFVYNFAEIDAKGSESSDTSVSAGISNGSAYTPLVQVSNAESSTSYKDSNSVEWTKHSMKVSIDMDVYYASIDEAKAKMGEAATKLLAANDIPGFFDACGPYYLRSISRRATYMSIFSYESKDTKRDSAFEANLKATITSATPMGQFSGTASANTSAKFKSTMSEKRTTIRSYGFGLGKDERADLVAYDIDTFKKAVTSAFISMQNDDVGIVTSVEVVPWVENPQFQSLVVLPNGEYTDPVSKAKFFVSPYAQKRILNLNSEFLAELDRAARAKLNIFYKAKMCKNDIQFNYMTQTGSTFQFSQVPPSGPARFSGKSWGEVLVQNNRTKVDNMRLDEFYTLLSPAKLNTIFLEYESFVYGGAGPPIGINMKDPDIATKLAEHAFKTKTRAEEYPRDLYPGVTTCVQDLLSNGFSIRSYRVVPTCAHIEQTFPVIAGRAIDDFCMVTVMTGQPSKEEQARAATQ